MNALDELIKSYALQRHDGFGLGASLLHEEAKSELAALHARIAELEALLKEASGYVGYFALSIDPSEEDLDFWERLGKVIKLDD